MSDDRPITAVILAAGAGTRIGALESRVPKPLTNLLGRSLLERALRTVERAGIERAVVVTGCDAEIVAAHVHALASRVGIEVDLVPCPQWDEGNGASLLAAEPCVSDDFLVMMVDHLTPASFLCLLTDFDPEDAAGLLVVDDQLNRVHDVEEATKVRVDGNRITAIGKGLKRFDAVDTGVFRFDRRVFDALRTEVANGSGELSAAVQHLARQGLMRAVASDGSFWCDVDTPEDLDFVRRVLERDGSVRGHELTVHRASTAS